MKYSVLIALATSSMRNFSHCCRCIQFILLTIYSDQTSVLSHYFYY